LAVTQDIFMDPTLIDFLATDSLIKATWSFLFTYGISLVHSVRLDLPRGKDSFIMEVLLTLGIPQNEIKICNHCRMFLRALFLSDIVTGYGEYLLESAW